MFDSPNHWHYLEGKSGGGEDTLQREFLYGLSINKDQTAFEFYLTDLIYVWKNTMLAKDIIKMGKTKNLLITNENISHTVILIRNIIFNGYQDEVGNDDLKKHYDLSLLLIFEGIHKYPRQSMYLRLMSKRYDFNWEFNCELCSPTESALVIRQMNLCMINIIDKSDKLTTALIRKIIEKDQMQKKLEDIIKKAGGSRELDKLYDQIHSNNEDHVLQPFQFREWYNNWSTAQIELRQFSTDHNNIWKAADRALRREYLWKYSNQFNDPSEFHLPLNRPSKEITPELAKKKRERDVAKGSTIGYTDAFFYHDSSFPNENAMGKDTIGSGGSSKNVNFETPFFEDPSLPSDYYDTFRSRTTININRPKTPDIKPNEYQKIKDVGLKDLKIDSRQSTPKKEKHNDDDPELRKSPNIITTTPNSKKRQKQSSQTNSIKAARLV